MKPYIWVEKPHNLSQVTESESGRGEGQSQGTWPHRLQSRFLWGGWAHGSHVRVQAPSTGPEGVQSGTEGHLEGQSFWLVGLCPQLCPTEQWLIKKQRKGRRDCQGQETLSTELEKSWAGACMLTTHTRVALVRCFHELYTPYNTLWGGDGETEAGRILFD